MRRTLPTLITSVFVVGAIGFAAISTQSQDATPRAAVLPVEGATVPPTPSVRAASGSVLAEMTKRLGTPRRVSAEQRKHAREFARSLARLRARERAAAATRARRAAAARAAAQPSYWFDSQATAVAGSAPTDSTENAWLQGGNGGWVESSGMARAPVNAPDAIKRVIQAGNSIARAPYIWGGGHGAWQDRGYDCSGSVSYALAYGGMLGYTQTSGQLMNWGVPGPGKWLTIYANEGHVFMYVAGLRFDTSGRAQDHASRWQLANRSADGFVARHYPGL